MSRHRAPAAQTPRLLVILLVGVLVIVGAYLFLTAPDRSDPTYDQVTDTSIIHAH